MFLPDACPEPPEALDNITHPFHYRLSGQEIDKLIQTMQECAAFMSGSLKDAQLWTSTSELSLEEVLESEEFQEAIGLPILDEESLKSITKYVESVEHVNVLAEEHIPKQLTNS